MHEARDAIAREIFENSDTWDLDDMGGDAAASIIHALKRAGYEIVPTKIMPAIACAIEECGPPERQTPIALQSLVDDYEQIWAEILGAAQPD